MYVCVFVTMYVRACAWNVSNELYVCIHQCVFINVYVFIHV